MSDSHEHIFDFEMIDQIGNLETNNEMISLDTNSQMTGLEILKSNSVSPLSFKHNLPKSLYTLYTNKYYELDVNDLDLDTLRIYFKEITQEMYQFSSYYNYFLGLPEDNLYEPALIEINQRIIALSDPTYENCITTSESEEVNGYKLYAAKHNFISYDHFYIFVDLMNSNKIWTFAEWREAMISICCGAWYKCNPQGEYYQGYWKYPANSHQRINACDLTFEDNCRAMWDLPFSKDMLLETIKLGCLNYMECVRYSNFVCVWVQRKLLSTQLLE